MLELTDDVGIVILNALEHIQEVSSLTDDEQDIYDQLLDYLQQ